MTNVIAVETTQNFTKSIDSPNDAYIIFENLMNEPKFWNQAIKFAEIKPILDETLVDIQNTIYNSILNGSSAEDFELFFICVNGDIQDFEKIASKKIKKRLNDVQSSLNRIKSIVDLFYSVPEEIRLNDVQSILERIKSNIDLFLSVPEKIRLRNLFSEHYEKKQKLLLFFFKYLNLPIKDFPLPLEEIDNIENIDELSKLTFDFLKVYERNNQNRCHAIAVHGPKTIQQAISFLKSSTQQSRTSLSCFKSEIDFGKILFDIIPSIIEKLMNVDLRSNRIQIKIKNTNSKNNLERLMSAEIEYNEFKSSEIAFKSLKWDRIIIIFDRNGDNFSLITMYPVPN